MPQNGQNFTEKYMVDSQNEITEAQSNITVSDTYLNLQPNINE